MIMGRALEIPTEGWAEKLEAFGRESLNCEHCGPRAARWYVNQHRWIRRHANPAWSIETAIAVFAILSTNEGIARNELNYLTVAAGGAVGPNMQHHGGVGHTGDVGRRVRLALEGRIEEALTYANARKIRTFYENLRHPWKRHTMATIDRHAGDILTGSRPITKNLLERSSLRGYMAMSDTYRDVAVTLELAAHELQAVTWVHHVYCEGNA